ncbi:Thiopurine S-methyltransferase [Moelleriella libera RCEF 2490]|uniref:Thiopurine S-methyltransferase n=1 Tax=Moelleriella libera RCEF 2490 TaxID=1081109 RepID=A0A167WQQ6_9HYPO|nr:Thiopurine S-methyltransferase [Moelleriella libera RCEF 2490]
MAAAVVPPDQLPPLAADDNDNDTSRADSRSGPSLALADLLLHVASAAAPPSSLGYDVVGLDADPDVIRLARENAAKTPPLPPLPASGASSSPGGSGSGSMTWDFLAADWLEQLGSADPAGKKKTFDLVYDYMCLSTLPPQLRPQWAKRVSELVGAAPDGRLPLAAGGPPWGVTPEVYEALLTTPGEPVAYDERGAVVEKQPAKPDPNALHRLSIIKPERTHAAGTNADGSIADFISVWMR